MSNVGTVLKAIASGCRTNIQVADKTGMDLIIVRKATANLLSNHKIISESLPRNGMRGARPCLYSVSDDYQEPEQTTGAETVLAAIRTQPNSVFMLGAM